MERMNDNLLRTLECPACLEYMFTPIRICIKGHSMCGGCWDMLDKCPICSHQLSECRNYSLEAMAELVHYPCENTLEGCNEKFTLYNIRDHHKVCRFRRYQCKLSPQACTFEGKMYEMEQHFYDKHPLHVAQGAFNVFVFRSNERNLTTHVIAAFGELFYIHRILQNGNMCWAVRYLGTFDEDLSFFCTLEMRRKYSNRNVSITEKCYDNNTEDVQQMITGENCIVVPYVTIETYKKGDMVTYSIEITRQTKVKKVQIECAKEE